MPVVIDPNSPALAATLSANAGLFRTAEQTQQRRLADQQAALRVVDQNNSRRLAEQQLALQGQGQQFGQQAQSYQLGLSGAASARADAGQAFDLQQQSPAGLYARGQATNALDAERFRNQQTPALAQIDAMRAQGMLDDATAAQYQGVVAAGGNPFGGQNTAQRDESRQYERAVYDRRAADASAAADQRQRADLERTFLTQQAQNERAQLSAAGRGTRAGGSRPGGGGGGDGGLAPAEVRQRSSVEYQEGMDLFKSNFDQVDAKLGPLQKRRADMGLVPADEQAAARLDQQIAKLQERRDGVAEQQQAFIGESHGRAQSERVGRERAAAAQAADDARHARVVQRMEAMRAGGVNVDDPAVGEILYRTLWDRDGRDGADAGL